MKRKNTALRDLPVRTHNRKPMEAGTSKQTDVLTNHTHRLFLSGHVSCYRLLSPLSAPSLRALRHARCHSLVVMGQETSNEVRAGFGKGLLCAAARMSARTAGGHAGDCGKKEYFSSLRARIFKAPKILEKSSFSALPPCRPLCLGFCAEGMAPTGDEAD